MGETIDYKAEVRKVYPNWAEAPDTNWEFIYRSMDKFKNPEPYNPELGDLKLVKADMQVTPINYKAEAKRLFTLELVKAIASQVDWNSQSLENAPILISDGNIVRYAQQLAAMCVEKGLL